MFTTCRPRVQKLVNYVACRLQWVPLKKRSSCRVLLSCRRVGSGGRRLSIVELLTSFLLADFGLQLRVPSSLRFLTS